MSLSDYSKKLITAIYDLKIENPDIHICFVDEDTERKDISTISEMIEAGESVEEFAIEVRAGGYVRGALLGWFFLTAFNDGEEQLMDHACNDLCEGILKKVMEVA